MSKDKIEVNMNVYDIPILVEALEEQERHIKEADKEIERLNNIIKEVREKLLCYGETFDLKVHQQMQKELLEILDKKLGI